MNLYEAQEILKHRSPVDVRITRFLFRLVCFHRYVDHVAMGQGFIGPIIVSACENCGKRKYKSMDGA